MEDNIIITNEKIKSREFFGLSTFQFLAYFRRLIVYTYLAIFLRSLGLSNFEVTLMATVGMVSNSLAQSLLWGKLLDKFQNSKMFIAIGESIAGCFTIVMVLIYQQYLGSNNITAGFIIIFSLGFIEAFWSMSNVGWSALIAHLTLPRERKKIMARLSVVGGIGGIFGAQVGGLLYDKGDGFVTGIIFYIAALVIFLSVIAVLIFVHQRTIFKIEDNLDAKSKKKVPKFSDLPPSIRKTYIWFIISLVFINFGRNSIAVLTGIFLADSSAFNATGEQIAIFSNVNSFATILFGILIGSIIASMDDNKVLFTGVVFALLSILWLIVAPTFVWALLSGFLIGSSNVIIESSAYAIASNIIPEDFRGRLFGIYNASFFLSWGIAATFITGPIADYMISIGLSNANAYRFSFMVASLIVTIGIILLLYTFRHINSLILEQNNKQVVEYTPNFQL